MYCIQVLPILKHTFSEELTYWTALNFQVGDVIQVELNHRKIYAVVSSIVSLSEAKEFIKSRDFNIKKITTYTVVDFFSNAFIHAVLQTSRYYIRPFGEVLSEYIPKNILEHIAELEHTTQPRNIASENISKLKPIYIQKDFDAQIAYIEHMQATYTHICVIAPTDAYKKHIVSNIKHTEHITVITPIDAYKLNSTEIDVCILAYAGSEYYRHMRKSFDTRYMVRMYCKLRNLQLVEMDTVLPIYADVHIEDIHTHTSTSTVDIHLVDQTISKTAQVKRDTKGIAKPEDDVDIRNFMETDVDIITHKKLKLISPELYSLIIYAQKHAEDIFIYTTRKGLSSSVVCSDCGHMLVCETCKKPLKLEIHQGETTYICPQGHITISIDSVCPVCGSIHLQGLGSGTDALVRELEDAVQMPIITIDSSTTTQAGVRKIFKDRKMATHIPTIYIGTELALHQSLEEKFTYAAIASVETLLALPSPIAELEAARVIDHMKEKTQDTLVIQTRTPHNIVWQSLKEKQWNTLTTSVQEDTHNLLLPPYTVHIQLYISTAHKKSEQDIQVITDYIQSHTGLDIIRLTDNTRHVLHLFIPKNIPSNTQAGIYTYLKSLPNHIRIEVDSPTLM